MTRLVDTLTCHDLAKSGNGFGASPWPERSRTAACAQEDLEGLTGLKRSYISDMERGGRNPTVKAIQRLAEALEVEPAELLRLPKSRK